MISKIYYKEIGILKKYTYECVSNIGYVEKEILKFEADVHNRSYYLSMTDHIGKIKRGSSFFRLTGLVRIAHEMERILECVNISKENDITEYIDNFLLCIDFFNSYINRLLKALDDASTKKDASKKYFIFSLVDKEENILESLNSQSIKPINRAEEERSKKESELEDTMNAPNYPKATNRGQLEKLETENIKVNRNQNQSIRVQQEKIDQMMNIISELVIAKNTFAHVSDKLHREDITNEILKEVKQVVANVNRISDDLQNSIMSMRMIEIRTVFQKMPRIIRDIAQSTGKKIQLIMEGEDTEIDKLVIEQISDPLVHIIRNCADHGIEDCNHRIAKGKAEIGTIYLRAYHKNKYVCIEVEDDGKGIDYEKIKTKALEKGFITDFEAEKMSQSQAINLIFLPGFSTANKITEVSGRGVGMDIVKSNIRKINGNIKMESELDKGTKITIGLPLSLAVSQGLMVEACSENYIIPLDYIIEMVKIKRRNIYQFNHKYFTHLRDQVMGVEWLSHIFQLGNRQEDMEELNAVILSDGVENYAIVVDKLKNEQEFVMKTMDGYLSGIPGISGSTLLGNGQVVLVINPIDIIKMMQK